MPPGDVSSGSPHASSTSPNVLPASADIASCISKHNAAQELDEVYVDTVDYSGHLHGHGKSGCSEGRTLPAGIPGTDRGVSEGNTAARQAAGATPGCMDDEARLDHTH